MKLFRQVFLILYTTSITTYAKRISYSQFRQILSSEADNDFVVTIQPSALANDSKNYDDLSEDFFEEATKFEWNRALLEESSSLYVNRRRSRRRLRSYALKDRTFEDGNLTSLPSSPTPFASSIVNSTYSVPFVLCDFTSGLSGYGRIRSLQNLTQVGRGDVAYDIIFNSDEQTCIIQSIAPSLAISLDGMDSNVSVQILTTSMKMRSGLVDELTNLTLSSVIGERKLELRLCPGWNDIPVVTLNEPPAVEALIDSIVQSSLLNATSFVNENYFWTNRLNQHKKSRMRRLSSNAHHARTLYWANVISNVKRSSWHDDISCSILYESLTIYAEDVTTNGVTLNWPINVEENESKKLQDCGLFLAASLSMSKDICSVEAPPIIKSMNEHAQWITQSGTENYRPWFDSGLTGKDQVVSISDSGIDTNNCYFWDRNSGERRDGVRSPDSF